MANNDYIKLLKLFFKHKGSWVTHISLSEKYPSEEISEKDIERLFIHDFLDRQISQSSQSTVARVDYQISIKGLGYLQSLKTHKMTIALIIIALVTLAFASIPIIISWWS